ncbi:MAG: hypothetical protein IKW83_12140 [Muribaculaceae bacterium]|nr:hypothetical protein [Muribaculaceae bacterium]
MAIVFYILAALSLFACLYGASESKFDIVAYAAAAAIMFFFMGGVLHYLNEILDNLRRIHKEGKQET